MGADAGHHVSTKGLVRSWSVTRAVRYKNTGAQARSVVGDNAEHHRCDHILHKIMLLQLDPQEVG